MSIGNDIKDAFAEVGTTYTINRSGEAILSGEYCIYDISTLITRPFFRESILEVSLAYDAQVVNGDVIEFTNDSRRFLVTHKTSDMFEDTSILNEAVLLKCNVTDGTLMRASGEVWDTQTYHKEQVWEVLNCGVNGLLTEVQFGNKLEEDEEVGLLSISKLELYLPSTYDIRVLDRFQAASGEYYKVDVLREHVYSGITVAEMSEDTR